MQLIFDTETESCIDKKMALIDKESINEKFTVNNVIEKLSNCISNGNGNKENIEKVDNIVVDNSKEVDNADSANSEVNGQNKLNLEEDKDTNVADIASSHNVESETIEKNNEHIEDHEECIESITDTEKAVDGSNNVDAENIHQDIDLKNNTEHTDLLPEKVPEIHTNENSCSGEQENLNSIKDDTLKNGDSQNIVEEKNLDSISGSELDSLDKTEVNTGSDESITNTLENQEVLIENPKTPTEIHMKMDVDDSVTVQSDQKAEIKSEVSSIANDTLEVEIGQSSPNEEIVNCNKLLSTEDLSDEMKTLSPKHSKLENVELNENSKTENGEECSKFTKKENLNNLETKTTISSITTEFKNEKEESDTIKEEESEILKNEKVCENSTEKKSGIEILQEEKTEKEKPCNLVETKSKPENRLEKQNETKKSFIKSKLSLDILSDDEDTLPSDDGRNKVSNESNKQCINIEDDDDDIMLIDDENSTKPDETTTNKETNVKCVIENKDTSVDDKEEPLGITPTNDHVSVTNLDENETEKEKLDSSIIEKEEKKPEIQSPKPLLPTNFVSTCKKNLAEMTRSDLEEFCILKIVESVVDRGNLGEIKSQLKKMAQNIEEYKNKTKMLTKQNHALQVVLKSVQEELKKNTNTPITPLKISRSVGIQVLMSEKNKKKTTSVSMSNNVTNPSPVNKPIRGLPPQIIRSTKSSQQNIPVPRLVPANAGIKNNTATNQTPTTNNKPINTTPPSAKKSPAQRPEKRPLVKIPNDTVDLTDDEPPPKVISRPSNNQAVRLVPPQNLMAPQRPQLGTLINSPRKVYIPISGGQAQNVRPGQTFMLRTINAHNVRHRSPAPIQKDTSYRRASVSVHPAPLPDSAKQCQPPNWKLIPPAPEITLSKVDNGIVISWNLDSYHEDNHESIASYQIYAYQEAAAPPSTSLWKKIGDVKALPLPMACTLTQFVSGFKYYFAVRAVDIRSRLGPFSSPSNIMLVNK